MLDSDGSAPSNGAWGSLFVPSVAPVGTSFDVAFGATYSVGTNDYRGVFVKRGVTTSTGQPTTLITSENSITVPGLGSDLTITFASQGVAPSISEAGDTAFNINVIPFQNKQVLLTRGPLANDPLRVVAYQGMPFSGSQSGSIQLAAVPFAISPDGDIGYRASTTTATGSQSGIFRWDSQTSGTQLIVHSGDEATGPTDEFNLIADATNGSFQAEFGDAARAAFRVTTTGASEKGIWADDPIAGVTYVASNLDNAFEVFPNVPFVDFHAPAVNSLGRVAFRGCMQGAIACANDGIWSGSPGAINLVTRNTLDAPDSTGASTGDSFVDFSNPVLNEGGALAFRAQTSGYQGIWRRASQFGPQLKRVVKQGDLLRGTSYQFVSFLPDIAIADSGEIAFVAIMSDSRKGLFTTTQVGATSQLVKIVKELEAFELSAGQFKVIQDIVFHPGAYAMGAAGFIHAQSAPAQPQAIAFVLQFPAGDEAVVLTTVE